MKSPAWLSSSGKKQAPRRGGIWNSGWERKRGFLLPRHPSLQRWRPSRLSRPLQEEFHGSNPTPHDNRCGAFDLMNALIPDPAELKLMPAAPKASEAVVAELNSASILEAIQVRESTLTPIVEKFLRFQPFSH